MSPQGRPKGEYRSAKREGTPVSATGGPERATALCLGGKARSAKGAPRSDSAISVLLVDDHAVVREGYRRLLEASHDLRVVGEAASAAEAYLRSCQLAPDVVVMDISLPDASGIEGMRRILMREPRSRILVFSIHDEWIFPNRAMKAGAMGYVTKASAPEVLVEAVRAVARDELFLSADIARTLALHEISGTNAALATLSTREFEIARMLATGHSVREIAERLCLSNKTVANHQSSIRQKLGAETAAQLIHIATDNGLLAKSEQ